MMGEAHHCPRGGTCFSHAVPVMPSNNRSLDSASFASRTICFARDDSVKWQLVHAYDWGTTLLQDLPTLDFSVPLATLFSFCSSASVASRDQSHLPRRRTIRTTPAGGTCIVRCIPQ